MSLSSQETCAAIYKQLFTDAEWQIIDYALSEYQDHLDEDDNEIEIYNSLQAKIYAIFTTHKMRIFFIALVVILGANLGIELLNSNMTEIIKQRNESIQQTINNL